MALTDSLWHYRCSVVRVIDGDTIQVEVDGGFHNYQQERVRLLGLDTPEVVGATKAAGLAAKAFVEQWTFERSSTRWPFLMRTFKTDSFGRYLAQVWCIDTGEYLNQAILDAGHAVPA